VVDLSTDAEDDRTNVEEINPDEDRDDEAAVQDINMNNQDGTYEDSVKHDEDNEIVVEQGSDLLHGSNKLPLKSIPSSGAEIPKDARQGKIRPTNEGDNEMKPCPRFNAAMFVRGNQLYIYGGVVEAGSKETILDDCWVLNLVMRRKWEQVLEGQFQHQAWLGEASSSDEDGDDGFKSGSDSLFDSSSDESDDDSVHSIEETRSGNPKSQNVLKSKRQCSGKSIRELMDEIKEKLGTNDPNLIPETGEHLRAFYDRTRQYWNDILFTSIRESSEKRILKNEKEIRRESFALAKAKYEELKGLLDEVQLVIENQKELEEATKPVLKAGSREISHKSSSSNFKKR